MVVELISVGTELLLGNIVNTNAAYLAQKCAILGLSLYHQTVVGDNEEPVSYTHLFVAAPVFGIPGSKPCCFFKGGIRKLSSTGFYNNVRARAAFCVERCV